VKFVGDRNSGIPPSLRRAMLLLVLLTACGGHPSLDAPTPVNENSVRQPTATNQPLPSPTSTTAIVPPAAIAPTVQAETTETPVEPVSTPVPTPVSTPTAAATTNVLVTVGPGAVDDWTRSIVRDHQNRVWIVAANNNPAYPHSGPAELRLYRANQTGIPSSFEPVSQATVLATENGTIPFVDAAIDQNDRITVVWMDHGASGQPLTYRVFDVATSKWLGKPEVIDHTNLSDYGGFAAQGGLSLTLDQEGHAHVAYATEGNQNQIRVIDQTASGWGQPVDEIVVTGAFVWHPAIAVGGDGTFYLAAYDSTNRTILAASRPAGGSWSKAQVIARDVLGPESIDQGPALLVTGDDIPMVTYLDNGSFIRLQKFQNGAWSVVDAGGDFFTHAPGIGIYADGTIVVAGHDEARPPNGINAVFEQNGSWGDWHQIEQLHADGSEVFRWAGVFAQPGDSAVDLLFFDEDTNDDGVMDDQTLYYVALSAP
jgi:hypothetical protein